jgi:uncharacterized protein YqeY
MMDSRSQIERDLSDAMRAGDSLRKKTLRMLLSAIKLVEVEQGSRLDDAAVIAVIRKEVKSQLESIADAERANRPDLIAGAEAEIGILEAYLPERLSPEELDALAREAITEVGATSRKEIGQVMKALMPRVQGRAEGSQVSQVVRGLLE